MKKDAKIRTSLWINPSLLLLLNERGLTLSSFIGRTLPAFLDLPVDPREKMIQEDLEKAVLRARSTYELEIRELIKERSTIEAEKTKAAEPVKKIRVWDNASEEIREIRESQYDPQWHTIREKVQA
jgi:hypothetical protein